VSRTGYTLDEMCRVLAVSDSGSRAWKQGGTPDRTRLTDAQMLAWTRAIHEALKGAYGSPRMVWEVRGRGVPASKER
jgi:putative transposase